MIKNVVFDMDGLMFDSHKIFTDAWDYAGECVGVGKLGHIVRKTLGYGLEDKKKMWAKEFNNQSKFDQAYKYFESFMSDYFEKGIPSARKGLYILLEFLKNQKVKMAIASNSPKYLVEKNINATNISDCFDAIVCADMVENPKPSPDLYIEACKRISADPKDTFALEDSKTGVISAYLAGCKPIMVPNLCQPDSEVLKMIVAKYDDLEKVKIAFESGELS